MLLSNSLDVFLESSVVSLVISSLSDSVIFPVSSDSVLSDSTLDFVSFEISSSSVFTFIDILP